MSQNGDTQGSRNFGCWAPTINYSVVVDASKHSRNRRKCANVLYGKSSFPAAHAVYARSDSFTITLPLPVRQPKQIAYNQAPHGAWVRSPPWLRPFSLRSRGKPRVDDRRVLSGITFVNRDLLCWRDAPRDYSLAKRLYN